MKENERDFYSHVYFDDYDDYEPTPEPTEEELEKKLVELKKQKRKFIFKEGFYSVKCIAIALSGFAIMGGIGTIVSTVLGDSPFIREYVVRPAYIKTEFDSDGNVDVSKQYEPYKDMDSKVTYYSEWTDVGDKYASITTTYDLGDHTYEEVDGILRIKDHPSTEPVEDIILSDELPEKKDNYYEGVVYEVDENDTIIRLETEEEDSQDKQLIFILTCAGFVPSLVTGCCLIYGDHNDLDKYINAHIDRKDATKEIGKTKKLIKKLKNNKKVS